MYWKKEKNILQKWALICHSQMLRWLIGIILGKIISKSSNWQHIQRLKITILGANWQLFRLERIAKCSYFILSKKIHTASSSTDLWWKYRNFCCQFDDTIEVYLLLGINIWGLRSEWAKGKISSSFNVTEIATITHCFQHPKGRIRDPAKSFFSTPSCV